MRRTTGNLTDDRALIRITSASGNARPQLISTRTRGFHDIITRVNVIVTDCSSYRIPRFPAIRPSNNFFMRYNIGNEIEKLSRVELVSLDEWNTRAFKKGKQIYLFTAIEKKFHLIANLQLRII